jgi:toxin ParE1/3/4
MRLRFSPYVKHDLAEIAEYISQDSPRHAANWIRVLRSRFAEIAGQPLLYRLRPELGADARLAPVGHYVILFRVRKDTVRIERIVQGSRDLLRVDPWPPTR